MEEEGGKKKERRKRQIALSCPCGSLLATAAAAERPCLLLLLLKVPRCRGFRARKRGNVLHRDGVDALPWITASTTRTISLLRLLMNARARALLNSRNRRRLHATRRFDESEKRGRRDLRFSLTLLVAPRRHGDIIAQRGETIVSPRVMDRHHGYRDRTERNRRSSSESLHRKAKPSALACFLVRERRYGIYLHRIAPVFPPNEFPPDP